MFNSTHFWFKLIKWIFLIILGFFIFNTLKSDNQYFIKEFYSLLLIWVSKPYTFIVILLFSILNWYFESVKWKILVQNIQNISSLKAAKQVLISHSISFATPFKTGDYVLKTLFFPLKYKWKIVALNGLGNLAQLFITTVMGFLGIIIIVLVNPNEFPSKITKVNMVLLLFFTLLIPIFFAFSKTDRFQVWLQRIKLISKKNLKIILSLSFVRYIIFSHQYYFFLTQSEVQLSYIQSISLIFMMYLLSSYIGVMSLFDFVIKGSIGIWLFSLFNVEKQLIFSISVAMWGLNFLFPAFIGYILLLFSKRDWFNLKV